MTAIKMEFSVENIERAVIEFYKNTGQQQASDINQWLIEAQISKEAWTFSWQLLQPNKNIEVQFFGANSLHIKIARFWHEVPPDDIEILKTQLLHLVANFASGARIVLTRLCVALSSFLLQTMPERWPDAVSNVINIFKESEKEQSNGIVFEILRVLPEEFFTSHLLPQRRGPVRNELQKGLCLVAELIYQNLTVSCVSSHGCEQVLRCFSSWAQLGFPLSETEPLIALLFEALKTESLFEVAVDALIHVFSHLDNHKFPLSMQRLLMHILNLNELLHKAIIEKDMDVCQGLCKLIVISADHNTKLLTALSVGDDHQRQITFGIINMMLICSGMPGFYPVDECCSDFPFGFWYNFQDEILSSEDDRLKEIFKPTYMNLLTILLRKVQYPPDDEYNSWNSEEKESNRCYRQDIADCLMYLYTLLHQPLVCYICQSLEEVLERTRNQTVPWQEIETLLYALTSLAEGIQLDDCPPMVSAFHLLPSIPCTNCTLVSQAMYFIGAFSEWMGDHPEMLVSAIPLLLQGLSDAHLAVAATLALKEVVQENQHHLLPVSRPMLSAIKTALDSDILKPPEVIRLMSCLGYILSILPLNDILDFVSLTLSSHVDQLKNLATAAEVSLQSRTIIVIKLQMLASLFSSLNVNYDSDRDGGLSSDQMVLPSSPDGQKPQPAVYIIQQILPILQLVLKNYASDGQIVSETCEAFKRSISCLLGDFQVLLADVSSLIVTTFEMTQHPSLMDLAKQLMVLFVNNQEYESLLQMMFTSLCNRTLQTVASGASSQTDLIEALMIFLGQITKKNVNLLKDESCNLAGLYQVGVTGILMHESPTSKAACQFMAAFLSLGHPSINQLVTYFGLNLVEVLIRAVGGEAPRMNIDPISDVFLALNKHHSGLLCKCMNEIVNRDDFPNTRVTRLQKEQFAKRLITERTNKRKIKELLQEFTLLWRGLINTEYALQTSRSIT